MNKIFYNVAWLMLTTSVLNSCQHSSLEQDKNERKQIADSITRILTTSLAQKALVCNELILNGDITCDESKIGKVYIPCSGKISDIQLQIGDYVKQGKQLAVIHSAEAAEYNKQLHETDTEIKLAQRELQMKLDLQRSGMSTDKEIEEARERLKVAKAEKMRLQSVANINNFSQLSHAVLTAPISGYIITKNIYNNSYIDNTNNDEPAFEIASLDDVWVIGNVYESDIAKIHQGERVYITTLSYPNEKFTGTIQRVYSIMDTVSKTMKVRVLLHNPKGMLKPGMFANIHIQTGNNVSRTSVPEKAIVFENGHQYVVVQDNDKKQKNHYHKQEVKIDHQSNDIVYISQGLKPGKKVVCKNALLIFNALNNQ